MNVAVKRIDLTKDLGSARSVNEEDVEGVVEREGLMGGERRWEN